MAADGDWQDFYEFQEPARSPPDPERRPASPEDGPGPGGGFRALACSLEEQLSLCFRPAAPAAEHPRAAVRPISERGLLQGDE